MSAGDRDTLAGILQGTRIVVDTKGVGYGFNECGVTINAQTAEHLADVIASSDWLREHDRATYAHGYHHGYKDAAYEHDAAVYDDQDEYLRDRAERAAANEYRTTEDTDAH